MSSAKAVLIAAIHRKTAASSATRAPSVLWNRALGFGIPLTAATATGVGAHLAGADPSVSVLLGLGAGMGLGRGQQMRLTGASTRPVIAELRRLRASLPGAGLHKEWKRDIIHPIDATDRTFRLRQGADKTDIDNTIRALMDIKSQGRETAALRFAIPTAGTSLAAGVVQGISSAADFATQAREGARDLRTITQEARSQLVGTPDQPGAIGQATARLNRSTEKLTTTLDNVAARVDRGGAAVESALGQVTGAAAGIADDARRISTTLAGVPDPNQRQTLQRNIDKLNTDITQAEVELRLAQSRGEAGRTEVVKAEAAIDTLRRTLSEAEVALHGAAGGMGRAATRTLNTATNAVADAGEASRRLRENTDTLSDIRDSVKSFARSGERLVDLAETGAKRVQEFLQSPTARTVGVGAATLALGYLVWRLTRPDENENENENENDDDSNVGTSRRGRPRKYRST